MRKARDEGTVLLSTLLVMSVMSAVALALLTTVRTAATRTATLDAQAQAELYSRAARDFAQSQVDRIAGLEAGALNTWLAASDPVLLPFENGFLSLTVTDGSQCFRLSALSRSDGTGSDAAQARLQALMEALGVDQPTASRVAASATDWVDADSQRRTNGAEDGLYLSRQAPRFASGPHRTANTPFADVTELRAVDGMDETLFRLIRPHLCIGTPGTPTRFNINGADDRHLPVLAAILGGGRDAERVAADLLSARPDGGYTTLEAAPALDGYDNPAAVLEDIVFGPERISVEVLVQYGEAQRAQLLAYEGLDSGRPALSYRGFGPDSFPSVAWSRIAPQEPTP